MWPQTIVKGLDGGAVAGNDLVMIVKFVIVKATVAAEILSGDILAYPKPSMQRFFVLLR